MGEKKKSKRLGVLGWVSAVVVAVVAASMVNLDRGGRPPGTAAPTGKNGKVSVPQSLPACHTVKRPEDCYSKDQMGHLLFRVAPQIWSFFAEANGANPEDYNVNFPQGFSMTRCGPLTENAFQFCPGGDAETTYAGPKTMWKLYVLWPSKRYPFPRTETTRAGEIAVFVGLAHEYMHRLHERSGKEYDPADIKVEDSGDCGAGAWYASVRKQRKALGMAPQDDAMLPDLFTRIGQPDARRPYQPNERWNAFKTGWRGGLKACNKAYPNYAVRLRR